MSVPIAAGAVVAIIAVCYALSLPIAVSAVAAIVVFPLVLFLNRTSSAPAVTSAVAAVTDLFDDDKEKRRLERRKRKDAAAKQSADKEAEIQQARAAEKAARRRAEKEKAKTAANTPAQPAVVPAPPAPVARAAPIAADPVASADDASAMTKTAAKKAKKEAKRLAEAAAAAGPASVPEPAAAAVAAAAASAESSAPSKKEAKAAKKAAAAASAEVLPAVADAADADGGGWKTISTSVKSASSSSKGSSKSAQSAAPSDTAATAAPTPEKYEELFVPFKYHGLIIGPKGATLTQLMTATGAKIDMPKKESGSTKVQLSGTADGVAACKGAVESLIKHNYSTITHPGYVHDDMHVDESKLGAVIGPKGVYLKAIQDATQTRINVPDKESVSSRIVIVGFKENVRAAKLSIKELIAEGCSAVTHPDFVRRVVSFPQNKLNTLIGAKGQTIKSIQGNTSTRINLPERSSLSAGGTSPVDIVIWGTTSGVAQAEKEIERLLIPAEIVQEEPEEQYVNGTWGGANNTEDDLWD